LTTARTKTNRRQKQTTVELLFICYTED